MIKPTNKLFRGIVVTFAILNQMQGSIFIGLDLSQPDHKQYKEIQVLKQDESKSKVLSALGVITADEKSSPTLFKMVDNLAQKLSLPIPKILIFKGNLLWNVLEHCGIDFKCNAFAYSLSRSFGFICIGEDLIQYLSEQELEAIIAHELSHIHHNHVPKKIFLELTFYLVLLKIVQNLGLTNRAIWTNRALVLNQRIMHVDASDLAVLFLDLAIIRLFSRYCEKEADLTAITIIDDSQQLVNGLFKIEKISKLKQRIINDFISEIKSMHPLSKNRAQYIKKALKTDESQVA